MENGIECLTDEDLLQRIHSHQTAIDSSGDSENGDDYALSTLFKERDLKLDELAKRKGINQLGAYSVYVNWARKLDC